MIAAKSAYHSPLKERYRLVHRGFRKVGATDPGAILICHAYPSRTGLGPNQPCSCFSAKRRPGSPSEQSGLHRG
jgi:hypothetical protein